MGHESIHEAAGRGDLDTLKKMVEERPWAVDQDDRHGWRPIFHACLRRRLDIVRYLIDRGADLAAHDGYAMHYAAEVPDNKDVVSLLVGYGSLDAHTKPASEVARQFIYAVFLANVPRVDAMLRANPAWRGSATRVGTPPCITPRGTATCTSSCAWSATAPTSTLPPTTATFPCTAPPDTDTRRQRGISWKAARIRKRRWPTARRSRRGLSNTRITTGA